MKRALSRSLKRPGSIACLALAIAVVAPTVAESASPVRGVWQGQQTRWSGGNGWKTTLPFPVTFSLKRGSVVGFTESGGNVTLPCSDGQTITTVLPAVAKAKVHGRRFSGKQTKSAGGRKVTTFVSGRFSSSQRAQGKAVSKVQGCPTYKSVWEAAQGPQRRRSGPGSLPPIYIPFCRGQNIQMPDGSYFYNSCAYVARRQSAPRQVTAGAVPKASRPIVPR
jgi:hypothetical protein